MTRMLGRRPNVGRPRARLTAVHRPPVYTPPATLDRWSAVPPETWGMDDNDRVGDCTVADVDHELKAVQVAAGNTEVQSTAAEVLAGYSAITGYDPADPSTDQGAEMQAVREYWQRHGIVLGGERHQVVMFAELDIHDVTVAQWALDEFGAVGIGVNLPASAMDQFDAGQPWDVVADDGGILGGHAVAYVGYNEQGPQFATWGQIQQATWAWWRRYVEEAWASFLREIVDTKGQSPTHETLYQLGGEIATLTGRPNPISAPTPAPAPQPVPVPAPSPDAPTEADRRFAAYLLPWVSGHHVGQNRHVAEAGAEWLADKGLA